MRGDPCIDCNRIAAGLYKRATALVQRKLNGASNGASNGQMTAVPDSAPEPAPAQPPAPMAPLPEAPGETPQGIPPQHVVLIQGRPFMKFAGLLQMAHERGLVSLTADWAYNDTALSLAHAVATFQDGRTFEEAGDATPENVTRKVAPHCPPRSLDPCEGESA